MDRPTPVAATNAYLSRTGWSRLRCSCTVPKVSQAGPASPAVAPLGPSRVFLCARPFHSSRGSRDLRDSVLAKRRARRLAERLAKPAYVNTDACCRDGRAGLAYESARLGKRTELALCSDIVLAEHLALLMAMHDADARLEGRIVFRVDSEAVMGEARSDQPEVADAKREVDELLRRHPDWCLVLVARESNKQAHHLAKRPLRDDR